MFLFCSLSLLFFFFNDTATTEIYTYGHTLSLHDALPISARDHDLGGVLRRRQRRQPQQLRFVGAGVRSRQCRRAQRAIPGDRAADFQAEAVAMTGRSEEHTSELQSLMSISYAVFCLKKKKLITKYYDTKHLPTTIRTENN